jgi:hypothetical protein
MRQRTPALDVRMRHVRLRQHTPALDVRIRQHTPDRRSHTPACASTRQHTSAYVNACVSIPAMTWPSSTTDVRIRQHTPAYVSMRQHTSAYVSIRQRMPAMTWPSSTTDGGCTSTTSASSSTYGCIRQRMRQHTSAVLRRRLHVDYQRQLLHVCLHTSTHASAYVSCIMPAYVNTCVRSWGYFCLGFRV